MWISELPGGCEHTHPQTEAPCPTPSQQLVGQICLQLHFFPPSGNVDVSTDTILFFSLCSLLLTPLPPCAVLRCWPATWPAGLLRWAADAPGR